MAQSRVPQSAAYKAGRKAGIAAGIGKRKSRKPKASGTFAKKVLQVVSRQEETKVVGEDILTPAVSVPAAQTTPLNLARMLPLLGQGVSANQRAGDEILPVRACTYWTVFPDPQITGLYDITLNLAIVKVKGAGTNVAVAATPGGDFLQQTGGGNVDPNSANQETMLTLYNRYPINTDRYTVLKRFTKRFCKGANSINGPVGAGTNNSPPTGGSTSPCHVFTYRWTPPSLKYDNGAATLPTNHYPVYLIWATNNDASGYANPVKFAVRSELYFKDS